MLMDGEARGSSFYRMGLFVAAPVWIRDTTLPQQGVSIWTLLGLPVAVAGLLTIISLRQMTSRSKDFPGCGKTTTIEKCRLESPEGRSFRACRNSSLFEDSSSCIVKAQNEVQERRPVLPPVLSLFVCVLSVLLRLFRYCLLFSGPAGIPAFCSFDFPQPWEFQLLVWQFVSNF